ncbi:hypothetical protein WA026_016738 [Henosepilachna vigintioctopunctata]|uniref:Uncharacterized protein n=1 Tax=Henosepilachna vigintioctopunctata TaxID=420089 RepID=A0AAW1UZ55_9CUCU
MAPSGAHAKSDTESKSCKYCRKNVKNGVKCGEVYHTSCGNGVWKCCELSLEILNDESILGLGKENNNEETCFQLLKMLVVELRHKNQLLQQGVEYLEESYESKNKDWKMPRWKSNN